MTEDGEAGMQERSWGFGGELGLVGDWVAAAY
jgi:hypothetical protein